jgi:very-short-patch-repair endonuclease
MDQNLYGLRTHHAADSRIADIALRQHGVYSRDQAIEAGFTRGMIDYRLKAGRWSIADSSVYRSASTPPSWEQRLMAACLAGPAVASHRAAAVLWRFPMMSEGIIEVTALRHRRRRASDVVWHESYHLGEREMTVVDSIPSTKPNRTLLDLGVVLTSNLLEEVLDDGIRRNLLDIPTIWRRLEELGDLRPGAKRVRALLDSHASSDRPSESVLETRFRQLLRGADVPVPTPQFEIRLESGRTARVDFAYPDLKVAVELDGAAYHSSQSAKQRDRRRENDLVALGWRVLRFTWGDLCDRASAVVNTLRCVHRP